MDNPELIESTEMEIYRILQEAHGKGLSYERLDWLIGQVKKRCEMYVGVEIELTKPL